VKIAILGTGNLAVTLGRAWAGVGHSLLLTGRNRHHAASAADQIGAAAEPADPGDIAGQAAIIVVAVAWDGLEEALSLVGAASGSLAGKTVLDCTNPVDYASGHLIPAVGSAAEVVARAAAGAHVVKALHMFAGASWPFTGERASAPVVAICGDNADALDRARSLIADLGGRTAVIGGLASARQAEEAAGFVMRVVAAGANPRFAVPDVDPALPGMTETANPPPCGGEPLPVIGDWSASP
jgi:predicted dinucleotide-binding enzyme